jgi:PKD repeat protein
MVKCVSRKILWIYVIVGIFFICPYVSANHCSGATLNSATYGGNGDYNNPYIIDMGQENNISWGSGDTDYLAGNMSWYYGRHNADYVTFEYAIQYCAGISYAINYYDDWCSGMYFAVPYRLYNGDFENVPENVDWVGWSDYSQDNEGMGAVVNTYSVHNGNYGCQLKAYTYGTVQIFQDIGAVNATDNISFWYKVPSDTGNSYIQWRCYNDATAFDSDWMALDKSTSWTNVNISFADIGLPTNITNITIQFSDSGGSTGSITGYFDDVEIFTPIIEPPPPIVSFSSNITTGYSTLAVKFNDTSSGDTITWNWSFGDGTFNESKNTTHTYNTFIGNVETWYTVSLNTSNANGYNTSTQPNYIVVYPLNTSFTANRTLDVAPATIAFIDHTTNGTPTVWNWSFGDGNYSNLQNPTYNFTIPGNYTITLNASNSYSWDVETKTDMIYITEPTPPTTSFTSSFAPGSAFPQTIYFTDTSTGKPTEWNWSFTDLTGNSTEISFSNLQNPSHTFNMGNYSVRLNTSNYLGFDLSEPQLFNVTAYTVSMKIIDAVTTVYIGNSVYVIVDSLTVYDTNTGLLNITLSSGNHVLQTTSTGYVTDTRALNVTGNTSVTVALTSTSAVSGVGYYYPPTSAQIQFFDQYYRPLTGMYVVLTPINTTTEGNWTILKSIYGIAETSAYSPDDPVSGISDASGLVIFPSIKPVYYKCTAYRASDGLSYSNYIQIADERRTIIIPVGAVETAPRIVVINASCSLTYDNESTSWATFAVKYNDSVNSTTTVMAYIQETKSGDIVDQKFFNDTSNVNYTASFLPTKSLAYKYGYMATSTTYGVVNESKAFAGRNYVEPYHLSDEYKLWIAVVLMVVIGAVFSAYSVKFGAVVLPLSGFLFSSIGWISYGAAGLIILPVLIILGIAGYIRKKESETLS